MTFISLKHKFILRQNEIYMCGHSLGPLSVNAKLKVESCLQEWALNAVAGWVSDDWLNLPKKLGSTIANLIGAEHDEVILADNTTVNLFKVLHNALAINSCRKIILMDENEFPTDLYVAQGIAELNKEVVLRTVNSDQIDNELTEEVAVLLISQVNYRTSKVQDLEALITRAHEMGVIVICDLSHSVGFLPLNCKKLNLDFAVGCTYKYLNGGPGSPSFIYVNRRFHSQINSPICGWMGHKNPFEFSQKYAREVNVNAYLSGTPNILSLKALEGALEFLNEVDLQMLHQQSAMLADKMIKELNNLDSEFTCLSPKKNALRGGHVSFYHENGNNVAKALIQNGIHCDYRDPGVIRFCVNALYLDEKDIVLAIKKIREVLLKCAVGT